MKHIGIVVALFILFTPAHAKHNSDHPLSADDWKEVMDKVVLLEDSGLMPTLLPVIMRNQDTLELTMNKSMHFVHGERRTIRTW